MALINSETNEYLIVETLNGAQPMVRTYRDAAQRERDKAGTMDQYEITRGGTLTIDVDLTATPLATPDTLEAAIKTAAYTAIKADPEYVNYIDA